MGGVGDGLYSHVCALALRWMGVKANAHLIMILVGFCTLFSLCTLADARIREGGRGKLQCSRRLCTLRQRTCRSLSSQCHSMGLPKRQCRNRGTCMTSR